jgi:Ca2+/Na+ antiporter
MFIFFIIIIFLLLFIIISECKKHFNHIWTICIYYIHIYYYYYLFLECKKQVEKKVGRQSEARGAPPKSIPIESKLKGLGGSPP